MSNCPRIDDSLLTSMIVENQQEADSPLETVLDRVSTALAAAGAERVRYYQMATESIPDMPQEEHLYLSWYAGSHGPAVYPGFRIPRREASIDKTLRLGSLAPVEECSGDSDATWVEVLGLEGKRWVDVLVHNRGRTLGVLSFDWTGDQLIRKPAIAGRLRILGAILGDQLSVTEPAISFRLQKDLERLYRDAPASLTDDALRSFQKHVGIASLALFRYDWTRDRLVSHKLTTHPKYGAIGRPPEPEVFPTGKYLTGMAWNNKDYRVVRDFTDLKSHRPDLVAPWSEDFHKGALGDLQSVMYERVGVREPIWLVRAINDSLSERLPFIRKPALLQRFSLALSPIMDAERAAERTDAVADLQARIAADQPTHEILTVAENWLRRLELVSRLVVVVRATLGESAAPFVWGTPDMSVGELNRLIADPNITAQPRPIVLRRQQAGALGKAAGLTSAEGADLLLIPAKSAAFHGVLAVMPSQVVQPGDGRRPPDG